MKNLAIREAASAAGVKLWEIAEAWPCAEATFSRHLRREFNPSDTAKALAIIDRLSAEKAAGVTA